MVDIKKALVLGGGGARGSYEIGVWKALRELNYEFEIVTGSSVGALNAAIVAQQDMEMAYHLWEEIDTSRILEFDGVQNTETAEGVLATLNSLAREVIRARGVSSAPLGDLLREVIDEDKVRASDIRYGLTTFEVTAMKPHELFIDEIPKGRLIDYMLASSACFPAIRAHEIDGKLFIDGGYADNIPMRLAMRGGAKEAVVVGLKTPGIVHKVQLKALAYELLEPRWDLGALLVFDGSRAKRNIALGYNECMKRFGKLDGEKYTFHKGEAQKNALLIYSLFRAFFARMPLDIDQKLPKTMPDTLDVLPEYLAKYAVMRAVKKYCATRAVQTTDVVMMAAETAGELLEISPLEIYTFETFNLRIMNRMVRYARLPYEELGLKTSPALSVRESIAAVEKTLSPISRLNRMMYILAYLSDYEKLSDNRRTVAFLAAAMPEEFMAAVYLIALGGIIKP